jgi:cytochrome c biogenesis protein CcdA
MASLFDSFSIPPSEMTLAVAGWVGILASLHVCAVIRLPILAAFMMGTTASRKRVLLVATLLAAGLVGGTVFLGMSATPLADGIHRTVQVNKYVFWVLGACLIAVGALFSGLIDPQLVPERCRKIWERIVRGDVLGALLLGFILGLLQFPACPTSRAEFLAIVGAGSSGSGLDLLAGYAAGQSLLAWCVAVLVGLLRPNLIAWLRTRMCSAESRARFLAGNLLVVFGVYFVIAG